MPLTALKDEIIPTSRFREELSSRLKEARQGHVITVTGNGEEEPVAVLSRRLLADTLQQIAELQESITSLVETITLLKDSASLDKVKEGLEQIAQGHGLTPNDVRRHLGWPEKPHGD